MPQTLIGQSQYFLTVLDKISALAAINRPVLIIGERGTGKELIAKRLHYLSARWDKPLISLNCAAISDGVIDSELFGHESGAFTGAKQKHQGRFERAESGTLFLDELATAPLAVQEKLLRVIEYGHYERVGGSAALQADVRVICATNADLPKLVANKRFRADLLDRLAFDVIHLPPLRMRGEDTLLLAEHFAIKMCRELNLNLFVGFSASCRQQLLTHPWPGNVRELKNVIERAVYQHGANNKPIHTLCFDPFLQPWPSEGQNQTSPSQMTRANSSLSVSSNTQQHSSSELPFSITLPMDFKHWRTMQEQQLLQHALQQSKFNQRHAAHSLGLSYHQLRGLLRKYKMIGNE